VTFTLADSTFAFACNSRNEPNVALQASISYIAAVKLGERLIAEGCEQSSRGRTGVYDITVTREDGELVALFPGTCYRIKGRCWRARRADRTRARRDPAAARRRATRASRDAAGDA